MTKKDLMTVEYYDQLNKADRLEYRTDGTWRDFTDDVKAVEEEFDRIDMGRQAGAGKP